MLNQKENLTFTSDDLAVLRRFYIASASRGANKETAEPMLSLINRLSGEAILRAEASSIDAITVDEESDPIVPPEYEAAFKVLRCMYWLTRIDAMDIIPIGSGTRKCIEDALRIALELFCLHGVAWKGEAGNA